MRTILWLGTAAVLFSGISLLAQQANGSARQSASAGSHISESGGTGVATQPGSASLSGAANGSAAAGHISASGDSAARGAYSTQEMRSVSGELENKLDSKTAKVGDRVVLKTNQKIKTADGTVIPKGTRLIGRVTDVQARDSAHAQSELGLEFDRAELKDGQSLGIHSTIQSIGPRANALADESMADDDAIESPLGGGPVGGGARAGGGGRLIGGAPLAGTVDRAGSSTAQTGAGLTTAADSTMHTAGGAADRAIGGVGADAHAAGSAGGGLVAHATGLPGVMLQSNATDSSSGMLSASKRNVHLDSGTQMQLGIVTAARQ